MPDKQPIKLDYKTPEKGELTTAWTIIWRVFAGFCGIGGLIVSLASTTYTILIYFNAMTSGRLDPIAFTPVLGILALLSSFLTIACLRYAIVGDRKSQKPSVARITVWMSLSRMFVGFGGMIALMFALGLTYYVAWMIVSWGSESPVISVARLIVFAIFILIASFLSLDLMKYAIVGERKSPDRPTNIHNPSP